MPGWLEPADVSSFMGLAPADTGDDQTIAQACTAVEPFVERVRVDAFPRNPQNGAPVFTDAPAPDAYRGAVQLAARLYQRRNSTVGVAAFNDLGGPVYVARYDPDIAWLLRLTRPMVG